jgi:phosphate uptake regulator
MKRKIISQGSGGLTVYLPKQWTKERKISPGDEVILEGIIRVE